MFDLLFLVAISLIVASGFRWAFRTLPGAGWQIMAAVPVAREDSHTWRGLNLTYYGLFIAVSTVAASSVFLILMGALGVSPAVSGAVAASLFALCVPASSVLARVVEQRHNTLTIGGAAFLGIIIAPGVIWLINRFMGAAVIPVVPALAALAIAYAVGEGLGRLACISFGWRSSAIPEELMRVTATLATKGSEKPSTVSTSEKRVIRMGCKWRFRGQALN